MDKIQTFKNFNNQDIIKFVRDGDIQSIKNSISDVMCLNLSGFNTTTGIVQGLRFFTNTGTFDSGKIRIYSIN